MKTRIFIGGLSVVVIGILISVHCYTSPAREEAVYETMLSVAYWEQVIQEDGAALAYQRIAAHAGEWSKEEEHAVAHSFGAALYSVHGVDEFTVCDDQYLYGCMHDVIARVIDAEGIDALAAFVGICADSAAASCLHGVGHGLLAYLGYTDIALAEALAACEMFRDGEHLALNGCLGGVFMEYNVRGILVGEGGTARPIDDDWETPCDEFTGDLRLGCLFWQVQWWQQVHLGGADDTAAYQTLGDMCDAVSKTEFDRQACYGGIGTFILPASQFVYEPTARLCEVTSDDPAAVMYCKLRAYRALYMITGKELTDHESYCQGSVSTLHEVCTAMSFGYPTDVDTTQLLSRFVF